MATHPFVARPAAVNPTPELRTAGKLSVAFLTILGLGALAVSGGYGS